jgi:hypothetical protein
MDALFRRLLRPVVQDDKLRLEQLYQGISKEFNHEVKKVTIFDRLIPESSP